MNNYCFVLTAFMAYGLYIMVYVLVYHSGERATVLIYDCRAARAFAEERERERETEREREYIYTYVYIYVYIYIYIWPLRNPLRNPMAAMPYNPLRRSQRFPDLGIL